MPQHKLIGEEGYCLTQFSTAASYISDALGETDQATLEKELEMPQGGLFSLCAVALVPA